MISRLMFASNRNLEREILYNGAICSQVRLTEGKIIKYDYTKNLISYFYTTNYLRIR